MVRARFGKFNHSSYLPPEVAQPKQSIRSSLSESSMDGVEEFGSMVEDEERLLSLELLETDAHYQLKKKLMKLKGLDFMGVYFKNSSPNWRDETVKKLLRIARIIHMDEVELYFDGNDGSTPDEYCSPRNEIKALNEVLSVVDDALKSASLMKIGMLQGLRDLLICRIHEFAEKNRQEIVLIDNYNCSKEKALLQWGVKNDATIKLMIANVEGAGRGAIATDDLNVGDIALELPISMIITEELVYESDMVQSSISETLAQFIIISLCRRYCTILQSRMKRTTTK
uniref:Uncharacterized protein n=1 Tax=Kalanchoe fedtschenkoi TaxID=63787 RepID=A0A7N0VMT5_KALFE